LVHVTFVTTGSLVCGMAYPFHCGLGSHDSHPGHWPSRSTSHAPGLAKPEGRPRALPARHQSDFAKSVGASSGRTEEPKSEPFGNQNGNQPITARSSTLGMLCRSAKRPTVSAK